MEPPLQAIYLHVGCGLIAPRGWVNIDCSWNARLAKAPSLRHGLAALGFISPELARIPWPTNILIHDIRKGLPFGDGEMRVVYASHLIEHLEQAEAKAFVTECYRVLRTGGIVRLVTPDLAALARRYLDQQARGAASDGSVADRFLTQLGLIEELNDQPWLVRWVRRVTRLHAHKWLYDAQSLNTLLAGAGFHQVIACRYLESRIPEIHHVERADRLQDAVCLEGEKE